MDNFVITAQHELDRLEAELRADPRHEKIKRLRELLAMYEPSPVARPIMRRSPPTPTPFAAKPTAGESTKTKAMEVAITALLANKVQVHRAAILQHLAIAGIMGHEKKPMASLAAFLSDRKHLYGSDGKGNFRMQSDKPPVEIPVLDLEPDREDNAA